MIDDADIVPGWEGKIVGWVEDDTGQKALSGYQDQMTWHNNALKKTRLTVINNIVHQFQIRLGPSAEFLKLLT